MNKISGKCEYIKRRRRVFVAGHKGMVGGALTSYLNGKNEHVGVTCDRTDLDLRSLEHVTDFFADNAIDHIYLCAARVGGIQANNAYPAEFIHDNLAIQDNVIHAA